VAEPWAPALDDVGRLVLTRTRDMTTPGSDKLLGTFTANTTPDAGQAQAVIDAAVRNVLSQTGQLDGYHDQELLDAARNAAAWRAAADIELMDPNRDADIHVYQSLDQRAQYELTQLLRRLQIQGEGVSESVPFWSAPDPPPYADRDPGDFTPVMGPGFWGGVDGRFI
jgi:hypothetical protein